MKCQQAENWMDLALDAGLAGGKEAEGLGLPPGGRESLDAHLSACPRCRTQWELLRAAEQALRVPQPVSAPSDLLLEFRRRVESAPPPHPLLSGRPVRFPWRWLLPIGGLAAAGATAALVVALRAPGGTTDGRQQMAARPAVSAPEMENARSTREEWQKSQATPAPAMGNLTVPSAPGVEGRPAPDASKLPVPLGSQFSNQQPQNGGKPALRQDESKAKTGGDQTYALRYRTTRPSEAAPITPRGEAVAPTARLYSEHKESVAERADPSGEGLTNAPESTTLVPGRNAVANAAPPAADAPARAEQRAGGARSPAGAPPAGTGLDAAVGGAAAGGGFGGGGRGATPPVLAQAARSKPEKRKQSVTPSVSPTVLAALRRPVELQSDPATVQAAALELTLLSDQLILVDASVPETNIVPEPKSGQMWEVLQSVARQAKLRVLPRGDQLVLVPDNAPARRTMQLQDALRSRAVLRRAREQYQEEEVPRLSTTLPKAASKRGAAPAGPAGPAGPAAAPALQEAQADRQRDAGFGMLGMGVAGQPDARVWRPSEWGTLPIRGFLPITSSGEEADTGQARRRQAPAGSTNRRRSPATSPRAPQRPQ